MVKAVSFLVFTTLISLISARASRREVRWCQLSEEDDRWLGLEGWLGLFGLDGFVGLDVYQSRQTEANFISLDE